MTPEQRTEKALFIIDTMLRGLDGRTRAARQLRQVRTLLCPPITPGQFNDLLKKLYSTERIEAFSSGPMRIMNAVNEACKK